MPQRHTQFIQGGYYHVFNHSIGDEVLFRFAGEYVRFIEALDFYRYENPPIRFLQYQKLTPLEKNAARLTLEKSSPQVKLVAFCIMPNHFHLLVQPMHDDCISGYIGNIQNGYARFYNTKYQRRGPLFMPRFKCVEVTSESQLLHVSRYIHLNPYSAGMMHDINELSSYEWSSFLDYTKGPRVTLVQQEPVLKHFTSRESYKEFVYNHADYQRSLAQVKHAIIQN